LARSGAELTITDLKNKKELKFSLDKLKKFKNIKYVLGKHQLVDFRNKDMIIKAAGVPFDSIYLKEAKKNKVAIEMDASLFAKLADVKIIGITGTRGKSTVIDIIYQVLKKSYSKGNVFLGGNIKGLATLPLLKKVSQGDLVVLELDSWQLQGFGDSRISPQVAVFTNFLRDHMNYYQNSMARYFKDKANIFKYQNENDYLIVSPSADREIRKRYKQKIKSQIIKSLARLPKGWKFRLVGQHNQVNAALATKTLEVLGIKKSVIKKQIETYSGLPGRLELVRSLKGIDYYNDTNATTPDAVIAAARALEAKNIILIAGGADKALKYNQLIKFLKNKIKALILIKGTATDKILSLIPKRGFCPVGVVNNMRKAVNRANQFSRKNDIVLLSPGAASFGVFKNEYDRGEQFIKLVKKLN
jgi:UDP-N-acetylmuramoylalanine--D-glutamate ligase